MAQLASCFLALPRCMLRLWSFRGLDNALMPPDAVCRCLSLCGSKVARPQATTWLPCCTCTRRAWRWPATTTRQPRKRLVAGGSTGSSTSFVLALTLGSQAAFAAASFCCCACVWCACACACPVSWGVASVAQALYPLGCWLCHSVQVRGLLSCDPDSSAALLLKAQLETCRQQPKKALKTLGPLLTAQQQHTFR